MSVTRRIAGALLAISLGALGACGEDEGLKPGGDSGTSGSDAGVTNDGGESDGEAGEPHNAPLVLVEAPGSPADADCDMTGLWFVRQTTVSQALGAAQYANTWYYLQLQQKGEVVEVVEHFDCGIQVATIVGAVRLNPATTRALIAHNSQIGRKGSMRKVGDHCELTMERFWSVRGVDEEGGLLPEPRTSDSVSIAELAKTKPLPTPDAPDGEQDWDVDGEPGITWALPMGNRFTVQRDWHEWFSDDAHPLTSAVDFEEPLALAADFDNDEVVWGADSPLLEAVAIPDRTADNRVTFLFLGRDADDARAEAVLNDERFQTCLHAQQELPPLDE